MLKQIDKLALGAMMFGWKVPLIKAHKIAELALSNGINVLDTSPSYGLGLSEIICGYIVKSHGSDNVKISTKFSLNRTVPTKNFKFFLRSQCNASLNRLQKDFIEYYVLHNDENIDRVDVLCDAILELKKNELIKYFYISNCKFETVNKILNYEATSKKKVLDGFQLNKSLLTSDQLFTAIDEISERQIYTYSPLCQGLLSGKYADGLNLPKNSRLAEVTRHKEYYSSLINDSSKAEIFKYQSKAKLYELSLAEYAYLFLIFDPMIDKIIVGPSNISQLSLAIRACNKAKYYDASIFNKAS